MRNMRDGKYVPLFRRVLLSKKPGKWDSERKKMQGHCVERLNVMHESFVHICRI